MASITIKELHRATGRAVREAGASREPVVVTDHGKPVAILANPSLVKKAPRRRTFLPAFRKHILSVPQTGNSLMRILDAVRADR